MVLGESCPEKEGNERHSMAGSIWIYVLQLIHHPANALNLRTETRESGSIIEGSLEVKLLTIWTDEKQSREEAEGRERLEERRVRRKKMQMREKVGKSRNTGLRRVEK